MTTPDIHCAERIQPLGYLAWAACGKDLGFSPVSILEHAARGQDRGRPHMKVFDELNPPARLLLGPGPSPVHPRVMRALGAPVLGHLDPELLRLLDDTRGLLRGAFRTSNELTLAVSGTGMAGMEAVLGSLLEPGDRLVVCAAGFFGHRMAELAGRMGVEVTKAEKGWGEVFTPEEIEAAVAAAKPKAVAIVHAETSTGALQPLDGLGRSPAVTAPC